jgi:CheY-like chemotaxis protein
LILFALRKNEINPLRILVVDDDALSREVLALLLEHAGYAVETADSGDAALEHLSATPGNPPSVVLADLQMPGIAGGLLAQRLRQLCGTATLLLAMSGSAPDAEVIRAFNGFLLKPFTMEELAAAIAAPDEAVTGSTEVPDLSVHSDVTTLNQAVYDKLAYSMRPQRLEQLYTLCLNDVEERITRMLQTASNQEDSAYRRDAHAIKGGAGMLGAIELQTLAASIEENGIDANHVASLAGLRVACNRLRRILIARRTDNKAEISEEDA